MLPSAKSLNLFKRSTPQDEDLISSENANENPQQKCSNNNNNNKKIKTFPSIRNQFVIHIYYSLNENEIIQDIHQDYGDHSPEKIIFESDPHVSFVYGHYAVQYHQIEPLMNQLSDLIKSFGTFTLCLNHVKILPNSDETRFFIAVCESSSSTTIREPAKQVEQNNQNNKDKDNDNNNKKQQPEASAAASLLLNNKPINTNRVMIKSIHHILKQYRSGIVTVDNETLDNFIFHASLAWFSVEHQSIAETICEQLNQSYFDDCVILVKINRIHIKVGHICRIINLL